ncbi:hypothetical protein [Marinicella sp. W31]|uniref:hypothetical protein n=1 Tax=Marinicella sp. W31 TaxID=3023713 RepID=UPI003756F59E
MKKVKYMMVVFIAVFLSNIQAMSSNAKDIAINFNNLEYFLRWFHKTQYEFTPTGQEDLEKWRDMITFNFYETVTDGEKLASVANTILSNYTDYGAKIIETNSIPRTIDKAAEHLIVAVFRKQNYFETVHVRILVIDQIGASVIYSHREYGDNAATLMQTWIKNVGISYTNKIMELDDIPSLAKLRSISKSFEP